MDTIVSDSIIDGFGNTGNTFDAWMIIAIVELIIIALLLFFRNKRNIKYDAAQRFKSDIIKEEIDFENTFMSAFHSKELYDKLKKRCHPDRFAPDEEKMKIADDIFQRIRKYETNYNKLVELQEEAKKKLGINI